jgi:predicted TIM-barrel fold metal-dependent hydrolase
MRIRRHELDPEGRRLPVKLDRTSNGEFWPVPFPAQAAAAKRLAHTRADGLSRKLGLSRRGFLKSLSGAAASLLAMNDAFARFDKVGGGFAVPKQAALELEAAEEVLSKREFIFDVQTHHVDPQGSWRRFTNRWNYILRVMPQAWCGDGNIECFSAEHFVREIFLDSDTDMAVLSAVPAAPEDNPLSTAEAAATRAIVEAMEGEHRLLIHALVHPNLPGAVEDMARLKEQYRNAAWKTYTQWGPDGKGYWLDDERHGLPFIERARALGIKVICVHKGLPLFGYDYGYSTCRDIGAVARLYPDMTFIVYHSGYEPWLTEGPYDPARSGGGVDSLIRSLQDNGIAPNGNVYAELGSTWRLLMRDPDEASHVLGKLFKYVGEDRVLWGTDSIWYGSPQDQIQAFRTFQISERFRERYGYPKITPSLRAKVFGLNAASGPYPLPPAELRRRVPSDRIGRLKEEYREAPEPSFATYGPQTRREFLALHRLSGGRP